MQNDLDDTTPFPEPVVIEITDVFDLHTIPPREVKAVVEEYLLEAQRKPFRCASSRYSSTTAFTSRGGIVCRSNTSVISITTGSGNGVVSSRSFCIFAASPYNFL